MLGVPLMREGAAIGAVLLTRSEVQPFTQQQIDLINTFADQAVIAIANVSLFDEIQDKSRQLEQASQHKSQFLANMSHELRTPLNAIIGYSEILQEDAADLGQDNLVADLKKIESAGRHLLGLINDILDLSKIEAGKMDIYLEDVDIVPLLEEVRSIIVPMAEKNGNVLEYRLADNLGSMRTDRTKLKQSLLNLFSNASKFTENGRLTLDVRALRNRQADGELRRLRHRHRHDRGAARPAVPGVQPGRCLDHQEIRRHRPWARDHAEFLPIARRQRHRHQQARRRLDLHHRAAGQPRCAGASQGRRCAAAFGRGGRQRRRCSSSTTTPRRATCSAPT